MYSADQYPNLKSLYITHNFGMKKCRKFSPTFLNFLPDPFYRDRVFIAHMLNPSQTFNLFLYVSGTGHFFVAGGPAGLKPFKNGSGPNTLRIWIVRSIPASRLGPIEVLVDLGPLACFIIVSCCILIDSILN